MSTRDRMARGPSSASRGRGEWRYAKLLMAGAAKRRVTPPTWVPYLTSSGNGTCAPFDGVHDDLYARALVLDDGCASVAILAVDAVGYDNAILGPGRNFTDELRSRISARTGLPAEGVMLSATHSHSTPETLGLTPFRETEGIQDWLEAHLDSLASTVSEAWERRTAVRAYAGATQVPGVARHRRILLKDGTLNRSGSLPPRGEAAGPWAVDEALSVLYLEALTGRPQAAMVNYAAHPVVAMLLPPVSADYPGALAASVEEGLDGAPCLFLNGACGNVNSSCVTTNFDDVSRIGRTLGRAALDEIVRLKTGDPLTSAEVAYMTDRLELDARPCPPLEEAEKNAVREPSPQNRLASRLARKLAEGPLHVEIQAIALGRLRWIALPGEVFVETGLAIKRAGAWFVTGNANGWIGYFPIHRAYAEGGYEVVPGPWSRVAPGSAERLEAACIRLLERFAPQRV